MVSGLEVGIELHQFLRIFLLTFTSLVRARDYLPRLQIAVTSVKQLTWALGRKWHQLNVNKQGTASDKMGEKEKDNTHDKGHFRYRYLAFLYRYQYRRSFLLIHRYR